MPVWHLVVSVGWGLGFVVGAREMQLLLRLLLSGLLVSESPYEESLYEEPLHEDSLASESLVAESRNSKSVLVDSPSFLETPSTRRETPALISDLDVQVREPMLVAVLVDSS